MSDIPLWPITSTSGPPSSAFLPRWRWTVLMATGLAWAIALLALATLAEYAWNTSLGIDELLYIDAGSTARDPGRMGPNPAACFLLFGCEIGRAHV